MLTRIVIGLVLVPTLYAQNGGDALPKVFGGGDVEEIFWVRLDEGDLVLETLEKIFAEKGVRDGAVLSAVGGLETCRFHGVGGTMTELSEPVELLNIGGLIVDGKPHFHVVVSSKALGALGGHLEPGCKVLSQVEIGVAKFKGPAMTRSSDPGQRSALQPKKPGH